MSKITEDFEYSKDWTDPGDFPTKEYAEKTVRENIQLLFDEIKTFLNDVVLTAINDNMTRISNLGAGDNVEHDALGDEAVWANNIKDGEVTEDKYADDSITPDKFNATEVDPYIDDRINDLAVLGVKGSAESSYRKGNVELTKANLGLGNVDNTSDADKPISSVTQIALNAKAPLASPALTGTPTAPTAANTVNNTQLATTAFVHNYATKVNLGLPNVENKSSETIRSEISPADIENALGFKPSHIRYMKAYSVAVPRGGETAVSFSSSDLGYTPTVSNTLVTVMGDSNGAKYHYWGASISGGTIYLSITNENPSGTSTSDNSDTYSVRIYQLEGTMW